jgi:SAM-dependent methyltransferase
MLHQWRAERGAPTDNARYHTEQIRDALEQFEVVEATISHVFSVVHPALGGRRYGEALLDAVVSDGRLPAGARILEVGCGTGRLARGFLDRLRERHGAIYPTVEYTLLDLSAELQSSQRQLCVAHAGRTRFVRANIEDHDFGQERFDLVISNEMLGDLSVGRALTENVRREQAETEAERLMIAYGLSVDNAPPDVVVNTGAIRFVERLSSVLRDGGMAALTEHGSEAFWPEAVELSDHTEFSIQFGHLSAVARRLGLGAEVQSLGEWLGFDRSFEVLSFDQLWLLGDHVLPFLGREPLPTLAYDVSMLRRRLGGLIDRVGNLDFQPLERWDALNPFESFCVLLIRR